MVESEDLEKAKELQWIIDPFRYELEAVVEGDLTKLELAIIIRRAYSNEEFEDDKLLKDIDDCVQLIKDYELELLETALEI